MRELAILSFVTLDGVMQAPMMPDEDRSGDFRHGGWAAPYYEDVMPRVRAEAMSQPYDMLFGRKTYETFANHWPTVDINNPVAQMMNDATKYVASSTLTELAWSNARLLDRDTVAAVEQLKRQTGPLLQVHGSWQLIQTLLAGNLIDEFRLWTFPVIVGRGKRIFDTGTIPVTVTLVETRPSPNGVVMNTYRRA
ncbi:MAG: dihydrofolate reductase family protein [Hyphomicrobiaceae bacterium]